MDSLQVIIDDKVIPQSNEFSDLIQSLHHENGISNEPLYLYQGFWYSAVGLEAVMACQQHFQAQGTDIILVTAPKSGTTWLKSLVFSIINRTQYKTCDQNHPLLTTNPHDITIIPFLEVLYKDNKYPDHKIIPSPRLFATHAPYPMLPESIKTSKCRILYLFRNPKDLFVSMWHFRNNVQSKLFPSWQPLPLEEAFDRFCKGITWYGPLWEQALDYWKLSIEMPEKVLFLNYEDLKGDITSQLTNIAEYLGNPFSMKEKNEGVIEEIARLCSFEHLSNLQVNKTGNSLIQNVKNSDFFRKGEVGDWINVLTPSMAEKLDLLVKEKLHYSGLTLN